MTNQLFLTKINQNRITSFSLLPLKDLFQSTDYRLHKYSLSYIDICVTSLLTILSDVFYYESTKRSISIFESCSGSLGVGTELVPSHLSRRPCLASLQQQLTASSA